MYVYKAQFSLKNDKHELTVPKLSFTVFQGKLPLSPVDFTLVMFTNLTTAPVDRRGLTCFSTSKDRKIS